MGRLSTCGKTFSLLENFPSMGRLPIYGKSSHTRDFTRMGSLPMYGESSHIWEVFPYMENLSCMVASMIGDQQHAIQGFGKGQGHEMQAWPRETKR
jgi:hypothetical protein